MKLFSHGSLFFILCSSFICADLIDHLKSPLNKTDAYKMRNIDFIYMINLDERPEKFVQTAELFKPYGIYPYRFSAVNGWKLPLEVINDVGLKYDSWMTPVFGTCYPMEAKGLHSHELVSEIGKTYFSHCMSKGAIGICLSHISILKDAWDSGYETIWVMEDDVVALADPSVLCDLVDRLDACVGKDNWDVLFTDQDARVGNGKYVPAYGMCKRPDMDCSQEARFSEKFTSKNDISPDFRRITARFGAYSMIIRRSGIKKLLEYALQHKIFLPYDMDNYLDPDLKRYSLRYDLVTNRLDALSDNGGSNYDNTD